MAERFDVVEYGTIKTTTLYNLANAACIYVPSSSLKHSGKHIRKYLPSGLPVEIHPACLLYLAVVTTNRNPYSFVSLSFGFLCGSIFQGTGTTLE